MVWYLTKQLLLALRHRNTPHLLQRKTLRNLQPFSLQHLGSLTTASGQWLTMSSLMASSGWAVVMLNRGGPRAAWASGSGRFSPYISAVATDNLNSYRGRPLSPFLRMQALMRLRSIKWYSSLLYHFLDRVQILKRKNEIKLDIKRNKIG